MKQLIRETLPYGLALFLNVVFFKVDVVLLSLLTPPQQADTIVALYSLPMKIVEVGMMFGTVFLNSMLPLFSEALHTKQSTQESLIPLVHKAYRILLFF
jgi:O-antigen/teichoic acid export membrane protein